MPEPLSPVQVAAERIHNLLAELAEAIGPASWGDDEDGAPEGANVLLSEWVIVAQWMDAGDGSGYTTRIGSHRLQTAHRVGLLHEGLYGFGP